MRLDALIFGGGAAGLWLLDRLSRDGHHVLLLEARSLGAGQTVGSQGIIYGGLKFSLNGTPTKSSKNIREMPGIWRNSLLGRDAPNLTQTHLRSDCCHIWQADSIVSRAGTSGSRLGLRVVPESIPDIERPEVLQGIVGTVVRLPDQVISPRSFIQDLATQYFDRILKIDDANGLEFELASPGEVTAVKLNSPTDGTELKLHPRQVIFTAGRGNAKLRKRVGLSADVMQRRPLHMVMVRGNLPELNGHCLDGTRKRLTITSERDSAGRMVWQIGGWIAEEGVKLEAVALADFARTELLAALPRIDLNDVEWTTYKVDRAEAATTSGSSPESIHVLCAGNVTTGWPTKLALAPMLAQEIASRAASPYFSSSFNTTPFANWPRPSVALLPWDEVSQSWWKLGDAPAQPQRRAA